MINIQGQQTFMFMNFINKVFLKEFFYDFELYFDKFNDGDDSKFDIYVPIKSNF